MKSDSMNLSFASTSVSAEHVQRTQVVGGGLLAPHPPTRCRTPPEILKYVITNLFKTCFSELYHHVSVKNYTSFREVNKLLRYQVTHIYKLI